MEKNHAEPIPVTKPRGLKITETDRQLLSRLFAGARELRIVSEFTDGRTATRVFLVRPTDESGIEALPAVIKVGPKSLIQEEWQATQRHVLDRLSGFVPVRNVPAYIDHADCWLSKISGTSTMPDWCSISLARSSSKIWIRHQSVNNRKQLPSGRQRRGGDGRGPCSTADCDQRYQLLRGTPNH